MSKSQGDLSVLFSSQQNFTNFGIIDIEITRIYFPDSIESEKGSWLCYNCPFLPQAV